MNPLISIIAPVYKIPMEYLDQCFQSVLKQTYPKWELIIVDDGSPDSSGQYCDKYAQMDTRIKVYHQANQGVSVARNFGIEKSGGDYISFLDSDDWVENRYLEILVNRLEKVDYDICICGAIIERKNCQEHNRFYSKDILSCDEYQFNEFRSQLICRGISDYYPPYVNVGVPWGKLYKKAFLDSNNLRFKPGVKRMQDNLFNLYAFKMAGCISYINDDLYHYRDFTESACNKYNPNIISDFRPFLDELNNFVKNEEDARWKCGANKRIVTSINSYMGSYFFHPENKENLFTMIRMLNEFISTEYVTDAVQHTSGCQMNSQEKVFFYFVKKRNAWALYFLYVLKNNTLFSRK